MGGRAPGLSRRAVLAAGLTLPVRGRGQTGFSEAALVAPDGRAIRLFIWPARDRRRGTILFSHGAQSAPDRYQRIVEPWAAAGFEVLAPLHVDSTDHPDHGKFGMLESWAARLIDMQVLRGFAATPLVIAAGHSYGGLVALTLGGAAATIPPGPTAPLHHAGTVCVVAFSPPGATPGLVTRAGYAALAVPAFIETGTGDVPFGAPDARWQVHLDAFEAAPPGDKYALVLDGADHYFGGLIGRFDRPGPVQSAALAKAVDLSTTFLIAYGARDESAQNRLEGSVGTTGEIGLSRK